MNDHWVRLPAPPVCSIVILNCNGAASLRTNLPAVLALAGPEFEVIVVDNGSIDDSCAVVRELGAAVNPVEGRRQNTSRCRAVRLVRLPRNVGYARGKNAGARRAHGRYLWLLDGDIRPAKDSLARLVEFFEAGGDPRRLAMPLLLEEPASESQPEQTATHPPPETIRNGGLAFTFHGPPTRAAALRWPAGAAPYPIHAATGGVLFTTKVFWDELGGFTRGGFFHLDDIDLGARAQLAGGSAWCVPAARAWHPAENAARAEAPAHALRERLVFQNWPVFIMRNFQWRTVAYMLPACLAVQTAQAVKWALMRRDPGVLARLAAGWAGWAHLLPQTLRQRDAIQAARRRPDRDFLYTANFWRI